MITATIAINRTLTASVFIWNDHTGTPTLGNYRYRITLPNAEERLGAITSFRRNHPVGHMQLVQQVLRKEFPFQPENRYAKAP